MQISFVVPHNQYAMFLKGEPVAMLTSSAYGVQVTADPAEVKVTGLEDKSTHTVKLIKPTIKE